MPTAGAWWADSQPQGEPGGVWPKSASQLLAPISVLLDLKVPVAWLVS